MTNYGAMIAIAVIGILGIIGICLLYYKPVFKDREGNPGKDGDARKVFNILARHEISCPRFGDSDFKSSSSMKTNMKLGAAEVWDVDFKNFIKIKNGWHGEVTLMDQNSATVIVRNGETVKVDTGFRWDDFRKSGD